MDKATAIKMRDALKAGKNLPLRVLFMDGELIVDESNAFCYTKWDDANGILYYWRLMSPNDHVLAGSNRMEAIDVLAAPYDYIGFMRAVTPLKDMDDQFSSIASAGATMSDQFKSTIKTTFNEALHKDRWRLSPSDINAIHGAEVISDKDNYYQGGFTEPFKETRPKAEYNKYVDSLNSTEEESETPPDGEGGE